MRRDPMRRDKHVVGAVVMGLLLSAGLVWAKEVPIGERKAIEGAGLEVAAVYLQPIEMEPAVHEGKQLYLPREQSDIHLEADIHAGKTNRQGFRDGDWVPGLTVRYTLKNLDTGQEHTGILIPMEANDGPHYGANIKMMGLGNYRLTYRIEPSGRVPADQPVRQGFGRVSSLASWWKPFQVEWTFKYFGPGKKGGY
jgi:uncharacterized protein involved in high-affinity Fe2+ transport